MPKTDRTISIDSLPVNLLVLLSACAYRLVIYLQNRTLFIDESNVARNLCEKGFLQYFSPLDYEQYVPPLFMSLLKVSTLIFGMNSYSLRLVPLIASFLGLFFFFLNARKLELGKWAWCALACMGFTTFFYMYGSEVKQYTFDILLAQMLIWLSLERPAKQLTNKDLGIWAAVGMIAPWFSMPTVFVLAGVGVYYLLGFGYKKITKEHLRYLAVIFSWLFSFVIYYLLVLSQDIGTDYLARTHDGYFLELPPTNWPELKHFLQRMVGIAGTMVGFKGIPLGGLFALIALGLWSFRKRLDLLILFASPAALTILAAGLKQYSLMDRLTLFFLPILWLIALRGAKWIQDQNIRFVDTLVILWMVITVVVNVELKHLKEPFKREQSMAAIQFLAHERPAEELAIIHHGAKPAFRYYTECDDNRAAVASENVYIGTWTDYEQAYSEVLKDYQGDFWLLLTNIPWNRRERLLNALRSRYKMHLQLSDTGCELYKLSQ